MGSKSKRFSVWLRCLAAILALAFLWQPNIHILKRYKKPAIAVFLDTSRSMRLGHRMDEARKALNLMFSGALHADLLYYTFDSRSKQTDRNGLFKAQAGGTSTSINDVLKLNNGKGGAGMDAIVIVSDGRNTVENNGTGQDVEALAASAGVPVFTLGVGSDSDCKDIGIDGLSYAVNAFKSVPLPVRVHLRSAGFPNRKIQVYLKENGELLAGGETNPDTMEAMLQFVPPRAGLYNLTVEVPKFNGELTYTNNQRNISVYASREKLRVLYISGKPGPEYAFLRRLLKADPGVELVTFVILRDAQDVPPVPEEELSLIPFPSQDILLKQLPSFDLVIFEEFLFYRYGISPANIEVMRKYVKSGGGLIIKGSEVTFGQGSPLRGTVLEELSPLIIGSPASALAVGFSQIEMLNGGRPVFASGLESAAPPRLDGVFLPGQAKAGASILGVVRQNGGTWPVFAVWDYGKGRVCAISVSSTWHWAMYEASGPYGFYRQFWTGITRWLTRYGEKGTQDLASEPPTAIDKEYDDPRPDFELLGKIARVSGGRFIAASNINLKWVKDNLSGIGVPQTFERKFDLLDFTWLLYIVVGILLVVWHVDDRV